MGEEWYDNKQLYEMLQDLKKDIVALNKEITETKTLIRDYNGLRQKIEETSSKLNTLMWLVPIMITGISLIFTFLNYVGR